MVTLPGKPIVGNDLELPHGETVVVRRRVRSTGSPSFFVADVASNDYMAAGGYSDSVQFHADPVEWMGLSLTTQARWIYDAVTGVLLSYIKLGRGVCRAVRVEFRGGKAMGLQAGFSRQPLNSSGLTTDELEIVQIALAA